jgi:hypothetical protein
MLRNSQGVDNLRANSVKRLNQNVSRKNPKQLSQASLEELLKEELSREINQDAIRKEEPNPEDSPDGTGIED